MNTAPKISFAIRFSAFFAAIVVASATAHGVEALAKPYTLHCAQLASHGSADAHRV